MDTIGPYSEKKRGRRTVDRFWDPYKAGFEQTTTAAKKAVAAQKMESRSRNINNSNKRR